MRSTLLALGLASLLLGCGDDRGDPDAGRPAADAAAPDVDAGGERDAGRRLDAGAAIDAAQGVDAGAPGPDSGAGTDAGGAVDAGAGADAGGAADGGAGDCSATVSSLGIPADAVGEPVVAHHPGGTTLIAWTDFERDRVFAVLRRADGSVADLGDLGLYSFTGPDPFTRPAAVARSGGFTTAWIEEYLDSGGFRRWRVRTVSLAADGTRGADTTFVPGYRVGFTDVAPRLFDVSTADVLVYLGRTSDALPLERLVFRSLSGGSWTLDDGVPEQVAWDGTHFAHVERVDAQLRIRRFTVDGTETTPAITVARPTAATGALRIAAAIDGWSIVDGDRAYRVSGAGAIVGAPIEVNLARSVVAGDGEALILGRIASGEATVWRLTEAGAESLELPFHPVRTVMDIHPDAAAWTGTQWVLAFADDVPGLDDQARVAVLCE